MNAFEILGIAPTSNTNAVRQAYRQLVKIHHPDVGGSAEKFKVILAAYQEAMRLACEKKCSKCLGTRKLVIRRGVSSVEIRCPVCRQEETK